MLVEFSWISAMCFLISQSFWYFMKQFPHSYISHVFKWIIRFFKSLNFVSHKQHLKSLVLHFHRCTSIDSGVIHSFNYLVIFKTVKSHLNMSILVPFFSISILWFNSMNCKMLFDRFINIGISLDDRWVTNEASLSQYDHGNDKQKCNESHYDIFPEINVLELNNQINCLKTVNSNPGALYEMVNIFVKKRCCEI